MHSRRFRRFGQLQMLIGTLLLMFAGGSISSWGVAYGQTAGPTPTGNQAALGISITVDNATPRPGDTVTWTIVVGNTGSADAREVQAADLIPDGFEIIDGVASRGRLVIDGQEVQ